MLSPARTRENFTGPQFPRTCGGTPGQQQAQAAAAAQQASGAEWNGFPLPEGWIALVRAIKEASETELRAAAVAVTAAAGVPRSWCTGWGWLRCSTSLRHGPGWACASAPTRCPSCSPTRCGPTAAATSRWN